MTASASAPTVVSAIATRLIGPYEARDVGRLKMPTPMMLPTISAVADPRPSVPRGSSSTGAGGGPAGGADAVVIGLPWSARNRWRPVQFRSRQGSSSAKDESGQARSPRGWPAPPRPLPAPVPRTTLPVRGAHAGPARPAVRLRDGGQSRAAARLKPGRARGGDGLAAGRLPGP